MIEKIEGFLVRREKGNLRDRMNLKPAMLGVEHVNAGYFYPIAFVGQANLLLPAPAGLLGGFVCDGKYADRFKHKVASLGLCVLAID